MFSTEFFVTSSLDGSAKMFYTHIAISADQHMTHFSQASDYIWAIQSGNKAALALTEDG